MKNFALKKCRNMFLEAIFRIRENVFQSFRTKFLAYKISHCLSANHNPELRCVICTGVTLFALVLYLNCTPLSQSESSNFSCVSLASQTALPCSLALYCLLPSQSFLTFFLAQKAMGRLCPSSLVNYCTFNHKNYNFFACDWLKKSYFPVIRLPSCYRTVCYWIVCYWTVCYRTV